ncbi:hypothetical protein OIDMADRAFT_46480 [Oidiodendron maius Zn]|uniref:Hemerythrin-like domain-containing protein n=1 Tax=Oidiodendron maius (strain Zn) TaxID=913774 RepID=A0A0C3GN40_OIDMZ|nr:hypothetical protein OIDMADRAFT_46480 [Oidiodendron maius Zn]
MAKAWADGPLPLIPTPRKLLEGKAQTDAEKAATEMAIVHNILIRGLNCMILQAGNVKEPSDVRDFMTYAQTWVHTVHEHHKSEETIAFPFFEKETGENGIMNRNIDQHKGFSLGLDLFAAYINEIQREEVDYSGIKFKELIAAFDSHLIKHLTEEIPTITGLGKYKVNWKQYNKIMTDHAVKAADRDRQVPFVMTHSDDSFEGGIHRDTWPPFPWLAGQMFRLIYVPKHEGAWRFSPCDARGRRKSLPFA